ncbi:MAG: proton-translocating NADH-quinone oxidoreductase subunit M [Planctomycetaceae bacterium]|nr:proton-translocating NADH-quinone oxidoreductase subunit M [Planctomycetaceae bacterium]
MSPLTFIFGIPLLMALALVFVPADRRGWFRAGAMGATLVSLLLAAGVFNAFDQAPAGPGTFADLGTPADNPLGVPMVNANPLELEYGFKFTQQAEWIPSLGISYHVGVDGINVGLVLMAALVAFAAACCARDIQRREKEFYILLLLMSGGILGSFVSLDLFSMYILHEFALVPTFIMIGVWGRGEDRNYATFKITLYLSLGALLALAGILGLYFAMGQSFNLLDIYKSIGANDFETGALPLVLPLLILGFGVLVSLWPFHTWAPLGYGSAPTATAMMHAGVIKKFGLYGLIRIVLPMTEQFPEANWWLELMLWLAVGNILFCGLVALRQKDLNWIIGNSSVAHMGFVFIGIASVNLIGVTGAVTVMIAHGLLAALAFGLTGHIHWQVGTLDTDRLGGLLRAMPFIGSALLMALLAGCGLPGFANFVGELTVFFGAWQAGHHTAVVITVWSALVIGAVYMLRAVRNVLHGPECELESTPKDASGFCAKLPYALLLAALLLFGFWPRLLTDKISASAQKIVPAQSQQTAHR